MIQQKQLNLAFVAKRSEMLQLDMKTKEEKRTYYYSHRKERIEYQRNYDKQNKVKKAKYDKKRRLKGDYNIIKRTQHYSHHWHLPFLIEHIGKCQICGNNLNLQVHHLQYDTKDIRDCLLVCFDCHKFLHVKNNNLSDVHLRVLRMLGISNLTSFSQGRLTHSRTGQCPVGLCIYPAGGVEKQ